MSLLKGFFAGIAYWLIVVSLVVTGVERDEPRLIWIAAGLIVVFLLVWRRVWRGRRRRSSSRRVPIPSAVRRQVYARDGFRCVYCGRGGRSLRLTIDHVFPVALGGTNDVENLVTACRPCNLTKGAKLMNDSALRRYANERHAWASRQRRQSCLLRFAVIAAVALIVAGVVAWFVM